MKRFLSVLLMTLILAQTLPLHALAAAGHVLTDDELAAAYALTGFGADGNSSNAASVHRGMTPNDAWNAMQVSDWLDDKLDEDMFNLEDILAKVSNTIILLKETDPEAYERFTGQSGSHREYAEYVERAQRLYREVEALRQTLRYQQDRIEEQAGLIAELGRQLREYGESMFGSERVRLSAKVEAAVSALRACRSETAEDAKEWEEQIGQWEDLLSGDDEDDGFADWIAEILAYNSAPAVNTARVNRVDASGTRMNRLSANDSVLSNGDNVTVHVMTENEICLRLYAEDGKNGKRYVQFARVRVTDTRDPEAEPMSYSTNKDGAVYIPTNELTLDSDKTVHFKLEVNAEKRGYRSFGIEEVAMKAGSVRMQPLVALDDDPYVYSAAFNGHDIINEEYEMIYSSLNDWDFEIRVEVRKPGGGSAPTPKLGYWAKGDSNWKWELQWAEPTGRDGNTYIFKDKWKRMFAPELSEKQRPFIAFSKDEGAQRFRTHLISLKSVVDSPVDEGSGAFKGIMGQGLGFDFKIPVIDANVSLNLPFKEYLPRISIDMAGIVTMSMGSELLQNKLKDSKLNWQSQDMADLKARMQAVNRECGFAQYKAQMGVAYDYYKEKRWKFLGASKLGFGMFGLVSARWEIDNSDGNITRKFIKGRGAMGETVVRLASGGKLYGGRGISTDIVGASIGAYLSALNKIAFEEAQNE